MTESSTALKEATSEVTETRRRYQALEIELQAAQSLVRITTVGLRDYWSVNFGDIGISSGLILKPVGLITFIVLPVP